MATHIHHNALKTTLALALLLSASSLAAQDFPIHRVDNPSEARERLELLWEVPDVRRSETAEGR